MLLPTSLFRHRTRIGLCKTLVLSLFAVLRHTVSAPPWDYPNFSLCSPPILQISIPSLLSSLLVTVVLLSGNVGRRGLRLPGTDCI